MWKRMKVESPMRQPPSSIYGIWSLGALFGMALALGVGEASHLEMDFGLGDEGADFGKAPCRAAAGKYDHCQSPLFDPA